MKKRRIDDLSLEERAALASEAGRDAVRGTLAAGLPVVGTRNGKIIRTYPDGREEVIKELPHKKSCSPY